MGVFSLDDAISLVKLEEMMHNDELKDNLLPVGSVLDDIPALSLDELSCQQIYFGRSIPLENLDFQEDETIKAIYGDKLIALGVAAGAFFKPKRVFNY